MRLVRAALILFTVVVVAAACGPLRYAVPANQVAAGADVDISADVKKDAGLTVVGIVIENLAPAERIKAGSAHFVAWQRTGSNATWSRIGTLVYDEGARTGRLEGVTVPALGFELVVSAEERADPASPSATIIVSQRVN